MSCATFESSPAGLNINNLTGIWIHPVGAAEFLTSFDRDIRYLLRRRIGFGSDAVNICQRHVAGAVTCQLAIVSYISK